MLSRPACLVLGLGLGSLLGPRGSVWDILAALLAHEHPFDRS